MSKKISEEEFSRKTALAIEIVKNIDWSSSKLKIVQQDKIDVVIEKLDKIIDLLTINTLTIPTVSKKEIKKWMPKEVLLNKESD